MKKLLPVFIFSASLLTMCSKATFTDEGQQEQLTTHPSFEGRTEQTLTYPVFEGKNLATFGNSITAAENSWAYQLSTELQFGNLYNGAISSSIWSKRERTTSSGLQIKTQNYNDPDFAGISSSNAANPSDLEFQKRINNCAIVHLQKYLSDTIAPTPDFIILSYGTNDQSGASVLGDTIAALQQNNLDSLNLNTIAGAVKWCIATLQTRFPNAKLYVALPIQATSVTKNNDNRKKIAIIKAICNGMTIPYFDCFNESGITQENSAQYLRDGVHPNEAGKTVHANYIISKLKAANGL